jgi:hypothetical protein
MSFFLHLESRFCVMSLWTWFFTENLTVVDRHFYILTYAAGEIDVVLVRLD